MDDNDKKPTGKNRGSKRMKPSDRKTSRLKKNGSDKSSSRGSKRSSDRKSAGASDGSTKSSGSRKSPRTGASAKSSRTSGASDTSKRTRSGSASERSARRTASGRSERNASRSVDRGDTDRSGRRSSGSSLSPYMHKKNYAIFVPMIAAAVMAASFFVYMKFIKQHDQGGHVIVKDFEGQAREYFGKGVSASQAKKYAEAVTYFEKARDNFMKMREDVVKEHGTLPANFNWIDEQIQRCNMALKDNREFALRQEQENSRY